MRVRIVAYTNLYMPTCRAGAQTTLRDLLRPLKRQHDITIVVHDGRGLTEQYEWEGIPVYPTVRQAEELGLIQSADLLITHVQATLPATRIAEEHDIPVVQLLHADEVGDREYLQHRCDLVVFNSHSVRKSFADYSGRSIVVYPPVDPAEYRTKPGNAVTLVNLTEGKGSKIFYALAEEFPQVQFHGVLGGYGPQDCRDMPNVTVSENTDDMRQVYGRTKILLMPSRYESFGRCAIEAAASGIPTIASPTPGLRESLGWAGIFCDPDDFTAWKAALRQLLNDDIWEASSKRSAQRSAELAELRRSHLSEWCEAINSFQSVCV